LTGALNAEELRHVASETIRDLIGNIRLTPNDNRLEIELFGEPGALLGLAHKNPRFKETGVQVTMVAGARNCLDLLLTASVNAA